MKILCCGCSFTYGSELSDRTRAWPYRLGEMLEAEVINLGQQASSNRQILHRVIDSCHEHKPDFVFVQWSLIYRTDHSDNLEEYVVWPGRQWHGNPNYIQVEHTKLVTSWNNPTWYAKQFMYVTKLLDSFLTAHNIPWLSIDFDVTDDFVKNYHDLYKIEEYLQPKRNLTLYNKEENICAWYSPYPKAPGQHPLEEGHLAIAQNFYKHYTLQMQ